MYFIQKVNSTIINNLHKEYARFDIYLHRYIIHYDIFEMDKLYIV